MSADTVDSLLRETISREGKKPGQLAAGVGVSHVTLSRWLSGKDRPSPRSCQKIATYTGMSLERILAASGHLTDFDHERVNELPEFREYARLKYPTELDEELISQIENLIRQRRSGM